jgi:hypothetical protein
VIFVALYLAVGVALVVARRRWRDAIYGVREGGGISSQSMDHMPTPKLPLVLALVVGLPLDVLLWPYNEWAARRQPEEEKEEEEEDED